jgi:hypothetical protein
MYHSLQLICLLYKRTFSFFCTDEVPNDTAASICDWFSKMKEEQIPEKSFIESI